MAVNDKVDKKKGAIFRMEEVGGKLYRVMYFKNDKGGLTRSKFIREVKRKDKKAPKKPSKTTRNKKLIVENRAQIIANTKRLNNRQTSRPVQRQASPQRRAPPTTRKASHKYVKPSGATRDIINEWTNRSKKR